MRTSKVLAFLLAVLTTSYGLDLTSVPASPAAPPSPLEVGQLAPDFSLFSNDYSVKSLADFAGRKLLVWFYPGAPGYAGYNIHHESGCAAAARGLQKLHKALQEANVAVVGVSNDPIIRTRQFAKDLGLPFTLLTDVDNVMAEAYGVRGHGHKSLALHRRVGMLIDEKGVILKMYDPSGTAGFAGRVLADVHAMKDGRMSGTAEHEHIAATKQASIEVQDADSRHDDLYLKDKKSKTELRQ